MDDRELLDEFVQRRSQGAFREIVERHLPVVYSAARRLVRDAHLAEEVAQSVFTTLAQKADSLRPPQVLGGWLYNTTRHLAMHAVRSEQRRREREHTASIMQSLDLPAGDPGIAEHLEPAMAELDAEDRDALVLRYLGNRGLRDVGVELGISEEAARKRVSRAVERLRTVLEKRNVTASTVLLATALSASTVAVPAGLGAVISTTALAPLAVTVAKTSVITMKWFSAKTAVAVIAGVASLGVVAFLARQSKNPPAVPAPRAALPIKFANDAFADQGDGRFLVGIDLTTRRTPDSSPAGHIKSVVPPAGRDSPDYLRLRAARVARLSVTRDSPLFGKRLRVTGWIKTKDLDNWAGPGLMIHNPDGKIIAMDEMMDRPIRGTTDWKQYEMVADVPPEICSIDLRVMLYGTGELWADDFQIDVVSTNTPITDDRRWHKWSPNAADYSVAPDPDQPRNGHSTLRIAYTPEGPAPRGSWMWWGQCIREPEKYAGRTVRMTVWIKCEDASGNAGINLRPKGPNFQLLTEDEKPRRHIRGTTDWIQRSIFCAIPEETQCLDTGFYFNGSGKLWIDMESLKYEIIDDEPAAGAAETPLNFTSKIPVIVLRSERPGAVSTSKAYSAYKMEIYEPGTNEPARLSATPAVTTRTGLRLHGMVSRKFPKLSYRLELQDGGGQSRKQSLLGMPADADWVLQGPWLDKSLIRNAFSYDLARAMGCAAMRTRACEVFLSTSGQPVTEADYVGVYQLTEDIERGEQRVNVTKLAPVDESEPAISGGYILAWDVGDGTYLPSWKSIQLKYPGQPSRAQISWIDRAFTRFDEALKGREFRDPVKGYAAHIEVDDWVNYILFQEIVFNLDGYTRSFYLHKDRGGKIRPGPVWDHDLALGHQFPNGTPFTDWWYVKRGAPHGWITRLMADPDFAAKTGRRWSALRKGVLSDAQVGTRVDAFAALLLAGAADRNFQRWKILDVESPFTESAYITIATATYPEQIVALKKFLRDRAAWMDANLSKTGP